MKIFKTNVFDLELLQEPIIDSLKKSGYTDKRKIEKIAVECVKQIRNELKKREGINENRMSQERLFNVEVYGMHLHGRIQFLLIQSGEYNIFQAIGYEIGFDVLSEGISLKCKHWDFFTELPKVFVYWDTKDKKSKVTVRDPE